MVFQNGKIPNTNKFRTGPKLVRSSRVSQSLRIASLDAQIERDNPVFFFFGSVSHRFAGMAVVRGLRERTCYIYMLLLLEFKSSLLVGSLVLGAVLFRLLDVLGRSQAPHALDDVVQSKDGKDGNAILLAELTHSTGAGLAIVTIGSGELLHAIKSNDNASNNATLLLNLGNSLTLSSASSDDIVNDENPLALQRGANNVTTLTMVLGFLAVERVADLAVGLGVKLGELVGSSGSEGNTLVGRAEDDVKIKLAALVSLNDALGIGCRDSLEEVGTVEVAGVEKVGRNALGLELEAAELEDAAVDGGLEEISLVR